MAEKKNNWIIWLIIGLCLLAIPVGILGKQAKPKAEGNTATTDSDWGMGFKDRIKVISLSGMIMDNDEPSVFSLSDSSTAGTIKKLRKAAENKKIKAVLL